MTMLYFCCVYCLCYSLICIGRLSCFVLVIVLLFVLLSLSLSTFDSDRVLCKVVNWWYLRLSIETKHLVQMKRVQSLSKVCV